MAEPENNKAGLQKKVSSVFKGVPLPQNGGVQQTAGIPASNAAPGAPARPASAGRQSPQNSLLKTLHQGDEPSANAAPDRPAQARPKPASADRQTLQHPTPRKPDSPEKPLKEAAPAKPHKAALAAEAGPRLWQRINKRLFPPKPGVSPARQKAMVILVPVLAIVMIFMFRQVLSTSPRQTQAATDDGTPVVAAAKASHEVDWQIPDPLPAMDRDPTKLPVEQVAATSIAEPNQAVAEAEAGTFDVRDIVYSKDKPSAVVNAHIVYVGHKVGSATVVQILKDGVEFERDGKRWVERIHD